MESGHRTVKLGLGVTLLPMLLLAWPSKRTALNESPSQNSEFQLREGTEVKLKLSEKVNSKTGAEGEPVHLVLDECLKVGDIAIATAGAVALGRISRADRSGILGRPGNLAIKLEYLQAGNSRVTLRGSEGKHGKGKERIAVVLTVLFGPVGLFKHGRNAEFKEGTPVTAYVDRDTRIPALGKS